MSLGNLVDGYNFKPYLKSGRLSIDAGKTVQRFYSPLITELTWVEMEILNNEEAEISASIHNGYFEITLSEAQATATEFDYLIIKSDTRGFTVDNLYGEISFMTPNGGNLNAPPTGITGGTSPLILTKSQLISQGYDVTFMGVPMSIDEISFPFLYNLRNIYTSAPSAGITTINVQTNVPTTDKLYLLVVDYGCLTDSEVSLLEEIKTNTNTVLFNTSTPLTEFAFERTFNLIKDGANYKFYRNTLFINGSSLSGISSLALKFVVETTEQPTNKLFLSSVMLVDVTGKASAQYKQWGINMPVFDGKLIL
jgi:hypothetical protein